MLEMHQERLGRDLRERSEQIRAVARLRSRLARGGRVPVPDLGSLSPHSSGPAKVLELPWPWAGERFELPPLAPLTFLTGPLGSGKTRLTRVIAESFEGGVYLGLDRSVQAKAPPCGNRMDTALDWIEGEGGTASEALRALLAGTEMPGTGVLVIDLVEEGLDEATQTAAMAYLRTRASPQRPLVLMTRSTAILDMENPHPDDLIIYCPANHSMPIAVAPWPGSQGYEAVVTCLAPPEVRARTQGVVAIQTRSAGA